MTVQVSYYEVAKQDVQVSVGSKKEAVHKIFMYENSPALPVALVGFVELDGVETYDPNSGSWLSKAEAAAALINWIKQNFPLNWQELYDGLDKASGWISHRWNEDDVRIWVVDNWEISANNVPAEWVSAILKKFKNTEYTIGLNWESLEETILDSTDFMEYTCVVDLDERGEFNAHVEAWDGAEVVSCDTEWFEQRIEDGYMDSCRDIEGMLDYLKDVKLLPDWATLTLQG